MSYTERVATIGVIGLLVFLVGAGIFLAAKVGNDSPKDRESNPFALPLTETAYGTGAMVTAVLELDGMGGTVSGRFSHCTEDAVVLRSESPNRTIIIPADRIRYLSAGEANASPPPAP